MKVGDLIKCKLTGKISIVIWTGEYGAHFKVMGYPINQVFNSTGWEKVNESR
jgi:hypothetical protein